MGFPVLPRFWTQHRAFCRGTGQIWPTYPAEMKNPDGTPHTLAGRPYQAHHINPQQLGGKHEWWNVYPVHKDVHQGGIHGKGSMLNEILKTIGKK